MTNYRKQYEKWLSDDFFDKKTRDELAALTDEREIEDRFYKDLTFGTGGLRGKIGAGTNRMNIYTVGRATQGLADFINSQQSGGSVAIAYDCRIMSPEFALDTALILAANGIKAYLFESLRPTPMLSFAVRYLKATAGVVITASHNPPAYNGYKVYWSDGGQIVPPYDKLIISKVNEVEGYADIRRVSREAAQEAGLLEIIGKEVDDAYFAELEKLTLNKQIVKKYAGDMGIVYTPLNGTGNMPVRRILNSLGFKKLWVVPEQADPDGRFPTLRYPNPEDPAAFTLALELAKEKDADLVLATDPDADRLGIYAKDTKSGEYMPFTGNMSGLLIAEYVLSQKREKGLLPQNPADGALVTTIVSSKMALPLAAEYGLTVKQVLTGFKYIGEQIKLFEAAKLNSGGKIDGRVGAYEYEFGYEESYGCLTGTYARDKDAVAAVAALCEAAAYYRSKGLTLWDEMQEIYKKYGYFREGLESVVFEGADGVEKISAICDGYRNNPPKTLGGLRVLEVRDYLSGEIKYADGGTNKTDLPKSNVIYFGLENSGWCCVRPSGTEPKVKLYFGVKGGSAEEAEKSLAAVSGDMLKDLQRQ